MKLPVDMSPEAIDARLRLCSDLSRGRPANTPRVDMSAEAIDRRLRECSDLSALCASLAAAGTRDVTDVPLRDRRVAASARIAERADGGAPALAPPVTNGEARSAREAARRGTNSARGRGVSGTQRPAAAESRPPCRQRGDRQLAPGSENASNFRRLRQFIKAGRVVGASACSPPRARATTWWSWAALTGLRR